MREMQGMRNGSCFPYELYFLWCPLRGLSSFPRSLMTAIPLWFPLRGPEPGFIPSFSTGHQQDKKPHGKRGAHHVETSPHVAPAMFVQLLGRVLGPLVNA